MTARIGKTVEYADELAVNAVKFADNFASSGINLNYQIFAENEFLKESVNGEVVTVPVRGNKDFPIGTLNNIQKTSWIKIILMR